MSYFIQCSNARSILSFYSHWSLINTCSPIETTMFTSSYSTLNSVIVVVRLTLGVTFVAFFIRQFVISRSKVSSCFATWFSLKPGRQSLSTIVLLMLHLFGIHHYFATRNIIINFGSNFYIYHHSRFNSHNLRTTTQLLNYEQITFL